MASMRLAFLALLSVAIPACSSPESQLEERSRELIERTQTARDTNFEQLGDRCGISFGSRFGPDGGQVVTLSARTYDPELLYQALSRELGSSFATVERHAVWEDQSLGGVDSVRLRAASDRVQGVNEVWTIFNAETATGGDAMRTAVGDSLRSIVIDVVTSNAGGLGCSEPNP